MPWACHTSINFPLLLHHCCDTSWYNNPRRKSQGHTDTWHFSTLFVKSLWADSVFLLCSACVAACSTSAGINVSSSDRVLKHGRLCVKASFSKRQPLAALKHVHVRSGLPQMVLGNSFPNAERDCHCRPFYAALAFGSQPCRDSCL